MSWPVIAAIPVAFVVVGWICLRWQDRVDERRWEADRVLYEAIAEQEAVVEAERAAVDGVDEYYATRVVEQPKFSEFDWEQLNTLLREASEQ